MNLDFIYQNPTTIYFGKTALDNLSSELANYGNTIMLAYGKGAIKKSGLYDQVVTILKESFVKECGIVTNLKELGATEEMLPLIANSTVLLSGGYKALIAEEVLEILKTAYAAV